jgi:superfamily II DNA or RNA helicase
LPQLFDSAAPSGPIPADTRRVARAMALLWTFRPRTAIYNLLGLLGCKREDGRAFTQDDVRQAIRQLHAQGWREDMSHRDGFHRLREVVRGELYRELLDEIPLPSLRAALHRLDSFPANRLTYSWPLYDMAATVALLRLELIAGTPAKELDHWRVLIARSMDWNSVVFTAAFPAFDPALFERITPQWRWDLAFFAVAEVNHGWRAELLPPCEWALGKLGAGREAMPEPLRLALGELLLHRGEPAAARAALDGLAGGAADALRACVLVQQGRWSDGQLAFEAAIKRRQTEVGARKRIFPASMAWLYPVALLAQPSPRHLEQARKFCLGEAGKRDPSAHDGWGRWVHAIGARLGDVALDRTAFEPRPQAYGYSGLDDLWKLLLAAWIGRDALGWNAAGRAGDAKVDRSAGLVAALRERLQACRLDGLVRQVDAAAAVLRGEEPADGFFVSGPGERWRDVLAALQALGADAAAGDASDAGKETTRIVWAIGIGEHDALESIAPFEQKRGPRGWGKPKPLSLAKIGANERLAPWDAKVARAIRKDRWSARQWDLDRAAAIMALVGHPAVVLADAPEQLVDVTEGTPEVETVKDGDGYRLRITPALRPGPDPEERYYASAEQRREADALRAISLVQDSPQRVTVIRLTAAQRRAAQLIAGRFTVPAAAHEELQQALRALAGHFQVHADHARAARDLRLRLVVAPLGAEGPRLPPGSGRGRLMAAIAGETVGTRRDLAAERAHLTAVLDALPFLDEPDDAGAGYEWVVADPERALDMVEALPKLAAIAAVDWPKGKSVRVVTVDVAQLGLVVKTERDWFRLSGRASADESLVLEFETLLAAAQGRSRFVPMGEGVYVALTRTLQQQLADLAAVVETDRQGARIPMVAAAWLKETLDGAALQADAAFGAAIERLQRAQDEMPQVPKALQAQLRPYQEDGYQWAMRLASAGLGGCLADDMGLGKTLQGLAVLLARGAGGAALVIAPTSVCGNWLAEAQRFAPTLNFALYGEAGRDTLLAGAGPMDVVIVSYTLLQQAQERFAARVWHTVIADEAQAIKNAAAKRSLAVFDLDAGFRLALSGTPVENRLAELWSIMRFTNAGLLGTAARFNERFATPIEKNRDRDAQQLLRRLIGPFVLRRTKAQVLPELPPRTELVITVAPEAVEAAHYEALRRQAVNDASRALSSAPVAQARINILAQLMRLRRAACDPRLVTPQFPANGAKVQAFADLATELAANGHKALVFSQFVDFLTLLRAPLDAAGISYQYLDGATPAGERTRRVAAFQAGQGDLFLISLKAGGFGLNLTAADYVLITDPWWNPAAEDQAMGRAHRIGQSRPVTVYRLVAKGTVEERIVALHQDKRILAESILAEGDAAALPSADDLIALIRGD